jgi:hypothetical protein
VGSKYGMGHVPRPWRNDIEGAVWLMRLSYLRFALKVAADPNRLLEEESKSLHLDPRLKELLGRFVPSRQQLPHA